MKTGKILILIISIFSPILGYSQNDISKNDLVLDTSLYYTRYKLYPIHRDKLFQIDKDQLDIHIVNPIQRYSQGFYQDLSNGGSPHREIGFLMPRINNIDYQPSIYPVSLFTKSNIRFYNLYKPYTRLFYSNTINASRYFSVSHAQNIYNNLHIGLEYNVDYSKGSFDKSSTKNQFFNLTSRYKDSLEVYEAIFGLIRNRAMQNESGGLSSDSLYLNNEYNSLNAYPVNLNSAYSKWKTFDIFLSQKYNFLKYHTSSNYLKELALIYDLTYSSFSRIYHDNEPINYDTCFYSKDLTHDSLSSQSFENNIYLFDGGFNKIGLRHNYIVFNDSLNIEKSSLFTPNISFGFGSNKLFLIFFGDIILSNSRYNKDYSFGGEIGINNKISFNNQLKLRLEKQDKSAEYFYNNYYSNHYKWSNDFEKIKIFNAKLNYSIVIKQKNNIDISLDYFNLKNIVILNEFLSPTQFSNTYNLFQLTLINKFDIGRFFFRGISNLNYIDNDEALRIPLFQAKQSIGYSFPMFKKKLDTYIGFDFRYNTSFYANSFSSSLGAFYDNPNIRVGNYFYTDFFIQAKIQRVKLFLTINHPYSGIFGYDYYSTPHYPQDGLNIRFGVVWRFFD